MLADFSRFLALGLLSVAALPSPSQQEGGTCSCTPNADYTTDEYHNQTVHNWLTVWTGDFSIINTTLTPDFTLVQDRFPFGPEPIHNTSALVGWINHSRGGWDSFVIKEWFSFGQGYEVALRWYLDGVIGNVSAHAQGSQLPSGSHVTYNGTDIIHIDPCSGLIYEVDSAQDLLTYFYNLGLHEIPLAA